MLTQNDIDRIAQAINKGDKFPLYYVANMIECREGYLDELIYKSVPKYKAVKVNVVGVQNALIELNRYRANPQDYHVEEEECYYDQYTKYIHYYIVPNSTEEKFDKAFNSRMPSAIYGTKKILYRAGQLEQDFVTESPVKEIYTNSLSYYDYDEIGAEAAFERGELNWKYIKIPDGYVMDGVLYHYVTSNYYILDIENFPRTEKPLVNVNQKTAYFLTNEEAQNAIRQYEA